MATESKVEENSGPDSSKLSSQTLQSTQGEADLAVSIKSLLEETQQLSELFEMERTYTSDVTAQLKAMISPLNASYHLKPSSISKNDSSITDAVLTPQGIVCVFHNTGNVITRPIESVQSDVLMRILSEVIPEIKVLMNDRRQKVSGRVISLERLSKEMKKIPIAAPVAPSKTRPVPQQQQQQAQPSSEQSSSGSQSARERGPNHDALRSAFGEKQ